MQAGRPALTPLERLQSIAALPAAQPLRGDLGALLADLVQQEVDLCALRSDLEAAQAEAARLQEAAARARRRASESASLFVATHRLHVSLDRGQVLRALHEIVVSLLGCEQMALFELGAAPPALVPVSLHGLAPGSLENVRVGEGTIGRAAATGQLWTAAPDEERRERGLRLSACVPLKVDGEVTGVLALFALLPHRGPLGPDDTELLLLLGTHAATALFASRGRGGDRSGHS